MLACVLFVIFLWCVSHAPNRMNIFRSFWWIESNEPYQSIVSNFPKVLTIYAMNFGWAPKPLKLLITSNIACHVHGNFRVDRMVTGFHFSLIFEDTYYTFLSLTLREKTFSITSFFFPPYSDFPIRILVKFGSL